MTRPLRIGIAGLGTVGASVARIVAAKAEALALRAGREIEISGVSARDRSRDRGVDLSGATWFDDPVDLAKSDEIDVFVELIGGSNGPARASVEAALDAGKQVVTANKALLAESGLALARMAEAAGVSIGFEAAVAGGIPVIKTVREAASANDVSRVFGILNGTCNYILTRMEDEGLDFEACLADAQRLGYAEADPTADIDGHDSAHKLALLATIAFGSEVEIGSVYLEGISSISQPDLKAADELGYRIKLLGVARRTQQGIELRVTPTMIPKTAPMARVSGVLNAVGINGDAFGEITMVGAGAGGDATASAVISDIVDVACGRHSPVFAIPADKLAPANSSTIRMHAGPYYVRLDVHDRPGAFAGIATRMAEAGISLESIVQHGRGESASQTPLPVIIITHDTMEQHIREALSRIEADGHIEGQPQMIRIERA
ncbi:homoserine dehydrogenase [Tepidamorphus sp. 3E244]|uniref:homoserine dehydrogenase n=1 Tax=Tepidamorphus sp. 3E244 TaxID=3385498 RepID=UPI0038FC5B60